VVTTTLAIVVFAGAILTQFRARAVNLTEEILRSDITTVLSVASRIVSGDDVIAVDQAGSEDSLLSEEIGSELSEAARLLRRSEAIVFVALPAENNSRLRTIVSTSPDRVEGVWESAEVVMAQAVQSAFGGETAINVEEIFVDEFGAWTSGFTPLHSSAGEVVVIIGADVRADWVFDGRDEIVKTTVATFLILYPMVIAAIFYISGRLTRPLQRMIGAAETVEKGEPFKPESIAHIQRYSDELGLMARVFSRMAVEVQARETALKQQVKALEIQIDQTKRNQQVEEITETEFFRDLQRKKEQLRASTGEKKSESNQL
jgi:HAMP domain-containing protein